MHIFNRNCDTIVRRANYVFMLGVVQNFINQVSGQVNKSDNPLGLSPGQIDEINQILTLTKPLFLMAYSAVILVKW